MPLNVRVQKPYDPAENRYPAWVRFDGQSFLVSNEDEEATVLAGGIVEQPEPPPLVPRVFNAPANAYNPADHAYPKWVKDGSGRDVIANNAAEERELANSLPPSNPMLVEQHEAEERALLLKLADVEGITVDKRWGIEKLKKAVTSQKKAAE